MMALLRFAFLKSMRDHSLPAFVSIVVLVPFAALAGATLGKGHWHYPFYLNAQYTPLQNANLAGAIVLVIAVFFSAIPAFWTFRPEIETRSIGSLLLAARPLTVALALILFAASIGLMGWIGAMAVIGALTGALPSHLALMTLKLATGVLAASSIGALVVTVSPQPFMIVCSYLACLFLVPFVASSKGWLQILAALVAAILCTALTTFLLERRCAT
jgi:hypothetical protein